MTLVEIEKAFQTQLGLPFVMGDVDGIALRLLDDKLNFTDVLEYFPKEDLPDDPEARLVGPTPYTYGLAFIS